MSHSDLENYKKSVNNRLSKILPILQNYALGDFSEEIQIPEQEDEFTELLVGLHLMADDIKVLIKEKDQLLEKQKHVEKKLELQVKKLDQVNEELKQFTYIVSHDLRAPLITIKGFSEELRTSCNSMQLNIKSLNLAKEQQGIIETAFSEDVTEALNFISSSVSQIDNFINSLLKLSRLGRRKLNYESIDMNALVHEIVNTLGYQIKTKKIKVSIRNLPEVVADRIAMEQIMSNLINNSANYLDPYRPGEIKISAKSENNTTVFKISDNGRGIADKDRDRVFALFRRAGKQNVPGEGMGLAYVKALIQRFDGNIWFESKLDVGTTFYFSLPNETGKGDNLGQ